MKMMLKRMFAVFCTLLVFGSASVMAQAVIKFEKNTHSFGQFPQDTVMTCKFKFMNTGDKPLVIHQAFASCGCTVADFTKTPIEPGKTGEVSVSYDGKNQFPGVFKKSVTVRSNASNAMARIFIEGTLTAAKE